MTALLREADRTWMTAAACRGQDPAVFFPDRGRGELIAQAQAVCDNCPVREACADYADGNGEQYGVWGGLSTEQRRVRARQKRRAGHG